MHEQIREHIQQVRRGEVPEGYLKTRAGDMPNDWLPFRTAKEIFKPSTNKKHNGQLEILSATQDRGIVPRSEVDIDIKFAEESVLSYKKVDAGDFVISLRSFQGGIEFSEYEGLVSPAYTVLKHIIPICVGYYRAYLKTNDFIRRLNGAVYGIRDGKQIGYEDFGDLVIHYPPIQEQEKIAEILSKCDNVVELKKKLIQEKRRQKKWLMQNLLDPDSGVRMPVYGKGWAEVTLAECTRNKGEYGLNAPACGYKKGLPRYIRITDIDESGKYISANDAYVDSPNSAQYFLQRNDLLFVRTGATVGKTYLYDITDGQLVFAGFLIRFAINPDRVNPVFAKYAFNFEPYWKWVKTMSARSGQPGINAEEYGKYSFRVPVSLDEQIAIAKVLSSADHEIQLLGQELSQWQAKKMALMQLLLSGLVRVSPSQEG
jgi:type I restriction enzyme, S subunit